MPPRMRPADVVAEQAIETQALVAELRRSMACLWSAAQASSRPELIEEARELAPDIREVERHARRLAALAEAAA